MIFRYKQYHFPVATHVTSYIPSTKEFIAAQGISVEFYDSKTGEKTRSFELLEPAGTQLRTLVFNAKHNYLLICDRATHIFKVDLNDFSNQVKMLVKTGERFFATIPVNQDSNFVIVGNAKSTIWKYDMALQQLLPGIYLFPSYQKQVTNITMVPDTPICLPMWRNWLVGYLRVVDHTTMGRIGNMFTRTYTALVPTFNKQRLFIISHAGDFAIYKVTDIARNRKTKQIKVRSGGIDDTSTSLAEMTSMRWLMIFLLKAKRFYIYDENLELKFDVDSALDDMTATSARYNTMFISPLHPTMILSFQSNYKYRHNIFALPEFCDPRCKQGGQITMCQRQVSPDSRSCDQCFKGTLKFMGECIQTCPPARFVNDYVNECQHCDFYHIEDPLTKDCKRCQKG